MAQFSLVVVEAEHQTIKRKNTKIGEIIAAGDTTAMGSVIALVAHLITGAPIVVSGIVMVLAHAIKRQLQMHPHPRQATASKMTGIQNSYYAHVMLGYSMFIMLLIF